MLRPPVIPGTRVIPHDVLRRAYYAMVGDTMLQLGIIRSSEDVDAFCDLAGIPD